MNKLPGWIDPYQPPQQNQFMNYYNGYDHIVVEFLRIMNSLPIGLGWIAWIFNLLRQAMIIIFLNCLVKRLDISALSDTALYTLEISLIRLLDCIGYSSKSYKSSYVS